MKYGNVWLVAPGVRKNRYWVARWRQDGVLAERSLRGASTEDQARAAVDDLNRLGVIQMIALTGSKYMPTASGDAPAWAVRLMTAARDRARLRGIPFSLTRDDMAGLVARAMGRCEVTQIPFSDERPTDACKRRPMAPSLDRITPSLGYTRENCRLVLFAVNVAMSDWGIDLLKRIVGGMRGSPHFDGSKSLANNERAVLGKDGVECSIHFGGTINQ